MGEFLHYYDQQTPEAIARAIQSVDLTDEEDGRQHICNLDIQFAEDLLVMLEEKRK